MRGTMRGVGTYRKGCGVRGTGAGRARDGTMWGCFAGKDGKRCTDAKDAARCELGGGTLWDGMGREDRALVATSWDARKGRETARG